MKRSAAIALVSMGAAAVTFYALRDVGKTSQAHVFRTVEDCILAPGIGDTRCRGEYRQALAEHERTAPRFDNREACETQFGAGACEPRPGQAFGAASVFVPIFAGYMFGANASRPFATQPLYAARASNCPPADPMSGRPPPPCPPASGGGGAGAGTSYRTSSGFSIWVGGTTNTTSTTATRTSTTARGGGTTTVPRTVSAPAPSRSTTVVRQGFGQTSRSVSISSRGTGS
jgi:hypothetical protein